MMMFPARTRSPPKHFTPWYFGLLSRPLREEPTPFLCAMYLVLSAEADVVDANLGEALPMTALARVVLSALVLEDDDLLTATVLDDLTGDPGTVECRNSGAHATAVGAEEHVIELDVGARLTDERRNSICSARFDTELLAAGSDDRVRHRNEKRVCRARKLKRARS